MTTFTAPSPTIDRDRYGRPLIIPPGGGKPVAYTRATTFIDVIEDKYNLQKWMQRKVAKGIALRKDLLLAAQTTPEDDKARLDGICEEAREAANASGAATTGTALHTLTEMLDHGQALPDGLDPATRAVVAAYGQATAGVRMDHIEQFCVLDTLKVGGTPDRIGTLDGGTYILDVKTGSIEFGALKIAMQLAIYARSHTYSPDGSRGVHGASTNRGIIIHLPAVDDPADAECVLHWVDLEAGWEAVKVAQQVRDQRKLKFKDLTEPVVGKPARPSLRLEKRDEAKAAARAARGVPLDADGVAALIDIATTADGIRTLWAANPDVWDASLTERAKRRIQEIETH